MKLNLRVHTLGTTDHSSFLYDMGVEEVSLSKSDIVMFTGGSDVSPKYYGQQVGSRTFCNPQRDEHEYAVFQQAIKSKKMIVGICRGFQAIHAFQGFPLVQHMTGHSNNWHQIVPTVDWFPSFSAPGDHHQNPICNDKMELLAYANRRSNTYLNGDNQEISFPQDYKEPEVAFYPAVNALGFQYHPEWAPRASECRAVTQNIFKHVFRLI